MALVYSEKHLEQIFTKQVKKYGGLAFKFVSPGTTGMPDRIVLLPEAKIAFAELKSPGKKMRPLQLKRKQQLEALGFKVYCIDSFKAIDDAVKEMMD